MSFITVTSIGGSIWSFNKDRIEMVIKRFVFTKDELEHVPQLEGKDSCAIVRLIGIDRDYFCEDSYESIMAKLD
jgi:hypothetical protein